MIKHYNYSILNLQYNEKIPGPKAENWKKALKFIEEILSGKDIYADERKKIKDTFHKYQDGNSSKRVFNEIVRFAS